MRNSGLDEAQAGIKIARRSINNLRYVDDTPLLAESEEKLKSLLMWVKEESKKADLKFNTQKNQDHGIWPHYFMSNRKRMVEAVTDIFLNSKITGNCDSSHEIKRRLLLGWKAMTNLDSILKSRDITLLTKVYIVKAMVFPVVMY